MKPEHDGGVARVNAYGVTGFLVRFLICVGIFAMAMAMGAGVGAAGVEPGSSVVVVYNKRLPQSKEVADYYAQRRNVPASQVFGFDMQTEEVMTRKEFIEQLQIPLYQALTNAGLFKTEMGPNGFVRVVDASIRYAALCFGVPVKVSNDPSLQEAGMNEIKTELRRTECAVESQLALLPWGNQSKWYGVVVNPFYGVTNHAYMHPTNGILMVSRLDGPGLNIAKGLVDKAMEAETNGLWGRAYFDSRGLTNGPYADGDLWIRKAASISRRLGFETYLDEAEPTFPAGLPMSDIALYVGWYDQHVSGPFLPRNVDFVPGAFAYHLHSYSATVLRSTNNSYWASPLLLRGVTATMGCVEEPYLSLTPEITAFLGRFLFFGNSFAEAAYASQPALSWQTAVIGDPLYRPYWRTTSEIEKELKGRNSPLLAWSVLMEANQNLALGADLGEALRFLQKSASRHHPIIQEKIATLFMEQKRFLLGIETYEEVLKTSKSPGQRLRVLLALGEARGTYGPDQKAFEAYQQILTEFPDYPEKAKVYQQLANLARRLGRKDDEQRYNQEAGRAASGRSR